jgi:hypothetical protein
VPWPAALTSAEMRIEVDADIRRLVLLSGGRHGVSSGRRGIGFVTENVYARLGERSLGRPKSAAAVAWSCWSWSEVGHHVDSKLVVSQPARRAPAS